jgi:hypothetical protein
MSPTIAALTFDNIGSSAGSALLWTTATAAGVVLLVLIYLGIFRRSGGRRLAWLLLALRAAGLAALWLMIAKPTWTGAEEKTDPGRVAVILDNSISMSLSDSSGKERYRQAREALEQIKKGSTDRGLVVDVFDINGNLLAEVPNEPKAERTDLARAVSEVLARSRSKPLSGVIILSDGADNSGRTDFRDLNDSPVPVFAAGFLQELDTTMLDLAVRKLQAPQRVMVNNDLSVDVPVTKTGPATKAVVSLKCGGEVVATQEIDFPAGPTEQAKTVTLKFKPRQAGSFVYTAGVATPEGAELTEPLLINNAATFSLQVDGEPMRVLYLEGAMRYEFKFLKARLEDDPDVTLATVLRRVNPEAGTLRPGGDVLTPDRLKNTDIVILGDMEGRFVSNAETAALLKWLDGKNRALLVLGGYASFGPDGWRTTPLAAALPVVPADAEPFQHEGPFVPALTDEGKRHPAFVFTGDHVKDEEHWNETARLDGVSVVQRAKPGATVLAVHPDFKVGDNPAVAMAYQNYGGGKVMTILADTTWKWSRTPRLVGRSDTLYARFWSQTVRWLAGRGLDENRPLLTVSTDRAGSEAGKPIIVKVTRQPRADVDFGKAELVAEAKGPAGQVKLPLGAGSANPDEFTALFTPPDGGRYEITARLSADGTLLANQSAEVLVQGSALELADPRANPKPLEAIAAATGGVYVDMPEAGSLVEKLPKKERRRVTLERREYWNSPLLFVVFLGAVTGEWVLRRRNRMV